MAVASLDRVTIKGFKSIRSLENFELTNLNVLIGANGAGKSNFIDFFRLLRAMMQLPLPNLERSDLKTFIRINGGSDAFLFNGSKVTNQIEAAMFFGDNGYRFKLVPTTEEIFLINDEERYYKSDEKFYEGRSNKWKRIGSGNPIPELLREKDRYEVEGKRSVAWHILESIDSWKIYHFHDTSFFASMRRSGLLYDHSYLRFDGANIAPYLWFLRNREEKIYWQIVNTIRTVAPFFDDFLFETEMNGNDKVMLFWTQKGSDHPLKTYHLSDGTLRFICLVTALLQPNPPSTFIIDEPELGLHPYAIAILAELIEAVSQDTQLIICTQSPALVDYFNPEDIVVVNREAGASTFQRLSQDELSVWLEEYSLGDLWQKNVIAAGPTNE
ncbi:MAG: AAA family ATPase [Candidatus Omnitrophota bacterium]